MSARAAKRPPPVRYPVEDDMGEHELQRLIMELLRPLIERWLRAHGRVAHAGADTFFYYKEGDPTQRLAPDIYVLDGIPQERITGSWKLWELERGPSFALEVVSLDVLKDYEDMPYKHGRHIGTRELVLFDPGARETSKRRRRWTMYRRSAEGFRLVESTFADRIRSETLGCWLRAVGEGDDVRARLALDPAGDVLFPTETEAAFGEAERAEREIARLRAELDALRAKR